MVKPSTSKLIREALMEGPKCVWEIYQHVKNKPAQYKRRHITYQAVHNMIYVLRRLGLIRRLSRLEAERRGLKLRDGNDRRIKPRYSRTYYEIVDSESGAWNDPYGAYSTSQ